MDFIGSQSSATEFFTVRGATMEMALESSLSGKPLSHFGITGPTVLNSVWMTESEVRKLKLYICTLFILVYCFIMSQPCTGCDI